MTYNTEAIVLSREDWNGNDSRVTLFTQTHGKVEAVARGLRKAKSKLAAHLEPLTATEVFLVEGRRFPIIAGSMPTTRYEFLASSLLHLTAAGLLVRLTDLMTPMESRDDKIFSLLGEALDSLKEAHVMAEAARLTHMFAWKLLSLSGYHAELRTCLECTKPITGDYVIVDVRRGGVLHENCVREGRAGIRVSFPAIKGLAYMVEAPLHDAFRLRSLNGALSEMQSLIEAMIEERFEVGAGSRFWAIL